MTDHPLGPATATLAAVVERLIPPDGLGAGALGAGGLDFIERQLRGPLAGLVPHYREGLRALDRFAGASFVDLTPGEQDAVLRQVEALDPEGEHAPLRAFFETVLGDTIDGFLADPVHGGNSEFAGWRLIGYPGPILETTAEQQELGHVTPLVGHGRERFGFFSQDAPAKRLE